MPPEPTATHQLTLVHATPPSEVGVLAADPPCTRAHDVPFHVSSRGVSVELYSAKPTATQKLVVTHDTWLSSKLSALMVGSGNGAQVVPFHISA